MPEKTKLISSLNSRVKDILKDVPSMIEMGDKEINATAPLIGNWMLRLQIKQVKDSKCV